MPDFPVALRSCADYGEAPLVSRVGEALDACGWSPARGDRVLLKPNLIRAVPLACTHPLVIKGAATWLLDRGVHVTVADSPGFGTAKGVARAIGLEDALRPLGLEICEMDNPVPIAVGEKRNRVPKWGVSRLALESDALLSLPKVKAHGMMRLSLAVKNLFGTVRGLRKAWAHTLEGENVVAFAACILELYRALPPSGRRDSHACHRSGSGQTLSVGTSCRIARRHGGRQRHIPPVRRFPRSGSFMGYSAKKRIAAGFS